MKLLQGDAPLVVFDTSEVIVVTFPFVVVVISDFVKYFVVRYSPSDPSFSAILSVMSVPLLDLVVLLMVLLTVALCIMCAVNSRFSGDITDLC